MIQPLALVVYEKLLPGSQLVNRLQDLNYRVRVVSDVESLEACAAQEKPMLVLADLESSKKDVAEAIRRLKCGVQTQHIPVIAFAPETAEELQAAGRAAGAAVVSEAAVVNHLVQLLEQALRVE